MRLLVNENVTRTVIDELRHLGYDVVSVKESFPAEKDDVILAYAQDERRIVVTHDKDFGELAFRSRLPASCGVILFRLSGTNPDADNRRIIDVIESRSDWIGHFSVVTEDRIRMRPLPKNPAQSRPRRRKR
jgi:predicted nuclease of predicted toxin-antitoxin system